MQKVWGFLFTLCLLVFTSCNNYSKDLEKTLKFINTNQSSYINVIEQQNEINFNILQHRLLDPATSFKAREWEPKAREVQSQSDGMVNIIKQFQTTSFNGNELWDAIVKFRYALLKIDPIIKQEFASFILSFPKLDSLNETESFIKENLPKLSPTLQEAYLGQLITQVFLLENRIVRFCIEQCPSNANILNYYSAIIAQSSSIVGVGEEVEIIAGVGSFSRRAAPSVIIDGKSVEISEDGAAHYKFNAPMKAGKYIIPAKINFTDSEGKQQLIQKNVEYRVVK